MNDIKRLWLLLKANDKVLTAIPLLEGKNVIGRGEEADIVLPGMKISARHCLIERRGNEVSFADLISTWGTLHNGDKKSASNLDVGDTLTLGEKELTLVDALPEVEDKPLEIQKESFDWEPFTLFLQELQKATNAKELVKSLLFGLIEIVSAERGFVLLESANSNKLTPVISHALPQEEDLVTVSSTIYKQALEERKTVLVENSLNDPRCLNALSLAKPEKPLTIVCCPLLKNERAFGVLYLDRPAAKQIAEESLTTIETIANLTASLLDATETRQTLVKTQHRLETLNILTWEKELFVLGDCDESRKLSKLIRSAAKQDVSVLITGETGTGKEMVARTLHRLSPRYDGPFVPVNCAALPPSLIEAELFGAAKGAYTGAETDKPGRFQLAEGGTLFLDEVGELPLDVQVKLLRVLQEREVVPVGGTEAVSLDFRLVCATNRNLEEAVEEGGMRRDFFYRINVFNIEVPPLRKRKDDIIPLAKHFLSDCCTRFSRKKMEFSQDVKETLIKQKWVGNIRELKNTIERAVVMSEGQLIDSLALATPKSEKSISDDDILVDNVPTEFDEAQDLFRRMFIERTLLSHKGNVSAAAKAIGLTRPTLYRHIKLLNIDVEELCKKS